MQIERIGRTDGRWPLYRLVVDGVDLGEVRRGFGCGYDALAGCSRYDGWHIAGTVCATRADAEARLIERGIRFGYIKED